MTEEPLSPGAKLRLALQLFDDGVALMRQNLRRSHPAASEQEIAHLLRTWLRTRPGAEHGDAPGRLRPPPSGAATPTPESSEPDA